MILVKSAKIAHEKSKRPELSIVYALLPMMTAWLTRKNVAQSRKTDTFFSNLFNKRHFLECFWAQISEAGMTPVAIVEHLDVINNIQSHGHPGSVIRGYKRSVFRLSKKLSETA